MNTADERLQIPPPPGCLTCVKRESTVTLGVARHRCLGGHPMHDNCGFSAPATHGLMHMQGAVTAEPAIK